MTQDQNKGFTLVEAAVAIAVVAILSGIIVPLVVKNVADAQVARAKNDVQVIAAAIASQMKDAGTVPNLAGGPGTATGAGQAIWQSGGGIAVNSGATAASVNTFTNLFTASPTSATLTLASANTMFGTVVGSEFSYKSAYMGTDVAVKSDPWGNAYMIYGYNATSHTSNGPIWVVSAGPDKSILATNVTPATTGTGTTATYPTVWNTGAGLSADDIAVRVN